MRISLCCNLIFNLFGIIVNTTILWITKQERKIKYVAIKQQE
jgi:hypothetical protein